jgi:hypothetical protein
MKRYFVLKLGRPDVTGSPIEVDLGLDPESRMRTFISSYTLLDYNDQFVFVRDTEEGTLYDAVFPKIEFDFDRTKYVKKGQDAVQILLTRSGEIIADRTRNGKPVFIEEITKEKADEIEESDTRRSLMQLWIAGV